MITPLNIYKRMETLMTSLNQIHEEVGEVVEAMEEHHHTTTHNVSSVMENVNIPLDESFDIRLGVLAKQGWVYTGIHPTKPSWCIFTRSITITLERIK